MRPHRGGRVQDMEYPQKAAPQSAAGGKEPKTEREQPFAKPDFEKRLLCS